MYIVVVKLKKNASRLGSCTVFPVRAISASSQPHRASKSRLRRLGVHHVLRLLLEHARMQLVTFLQGEKTLFLSRPVQLQRQNAHLHWGTSKGEHATPRRSVQP